jgi:glycosyltransferase involved in cell wall biosynthesis
LKEAAKYAAFCFVRGEGADLAENYCIFASNFFPNDGRVARYTYSLAKRLQSKGKNVFIVTNNVFGLSSFENSDGIKIYRLPCYNLAGGYFPLICYDSEAKGILSILKKIKFKAVIVNNTFHFHSLIGAMFGKANKAKVITICHTSAYVKRRNPVANFFIHIYEHIIASLLKLYTDEFYGVCKASSKWLKRFGIKSKGELYNSVSAELVNSCLKSSGVSFKEKYGIDVPIITYAGRLIDEKGLDMLISAFKTVKKEYPAALMITGDGEYRESLSEETEEGIYFLGELDFQNLISLLGETDIFCLPIDYPERVSSGVFEAASAGAFIITTESGGAEELINSEERGIILFENNEETIAEALKKALSDEEYRKTAVQKCKRAIWNRFSIEKTARTIIESAENFIEEEEEFI